MKQHQGKRQQENVLRNWSLLPVTDAHPSGALEEPQKMCLVIENSKYEGKMHVSISFSLPSLEGGPWVISLPAVQLHMHMAGRLHGCLSPSCHRSPRAGRRYVVCT